MSRLGYDADPRCGGASAVTSADEELLDLVLSCVLERGAFRPDDRARARELMAELRSRPTDAGRAAIRVEQELAPALPWSDLLAAIVGERWDALLERRAALRRHLRGRDRTVPPPPGDATAESLSRKQIRGSGLFLSGYGVSSGLKFAAELIVVRYLSTGQYGAWTYALAAVTFLKGITTFGLNRAITRYLPQHLERGELRDFHGVLAFVLGSLALLGAAVVGIFYAFPDMVSGLAGVSEEAPIRIMFILILMVPLETLDNVLLGVSAAFNDSRTIFVRRFLLHPGLRVAVAIVLVVVHGDVIMLAVGYVLAGCIGMSYYALGVLRVMRREGLLRMELVAGMRLPIRRVLSYTAQAMAADWGMVFMATSGPLLLGYLADMSTVALYQVVVPIAAMNILVSRSFAMLYEPSAARLIARGDAGGLSGLYWRSAVWVTVLTFPLFALSFTAAGPLIHVLYGERYLAAGSVLSLLALGQFLDCAAGFNAQTLRVAGKVRLLIAANAASVASNIAVSIVLIPSMGAVGAGVGTAVGYVVYAILKQTALVFGTSVASFDPAHRGAYLTLAVATLALLALRILSPGSAWILVPSVALASLVVLMRARVSLRVSDTFPELARWRVVRALLG
jgi:O-antigen/teichoic acid export membrane protein